MAGSRTSIRQPLLVYASLFMVLVALVVGVISWFSLVTASQRAYRRAARRSLALVANQRSLNTIEVLDRTPAPMGELTLAIASTTTVAFGLSLAQVRAEASTPSLDSAFVAIPIEAPGRELYLVGLFDSTVPMSIALVEVARMTPFVLLGALGCAGVLVVLVGRILLPPLAALREAAEETQPTPDAALSVPAPNEIVEVAHRFRQTVRQLNEERELVEAQRDELARMQQSLVRASKLASVGRLAAGIAHEIGNPLAAVQGYLSLLDGGLPEEQARDVLARSRSELTRIHETIQKLLTYARTGVERPSEPGPFDVRAALNEAIGLARGHPALRGIALSTSGVQGAVPNGYGLEDHFRQVIVNLLLNAGHALEGHPAPRVEIRLAFDARFVTVTIIDNGDGVPEDLKEAIFDPFYTTKAPGQGTGLGLAVSRSLMEAIGGDLTVADATGGGAAFSIALPCEGSDAADATLAPA